MIDQTLLLDKIERFLNKHRMEPTAFGVGAANDSHLVFSLRKGDRKLRRKTLGKIQDFMREYKNGKSDT